MLRMSARDAETAIMLASGFMFCANARPVAALSAAIPFAFRFLAENRRFGEGQRGCVTRNHSTGIRSSLPAPIPPSRGSKIRAKADIKASFEPSQRLVPRRRRPGGTDDRPAPADDPPRNGDSLPETETRTKIRRPGWRKPRLRARRALACRQLAPQLVVHGLAGAAAAVHMAVPIDPAPVVHPLAAHLAYLRLARAPG